MGGSQAYCDLILCLCFQIPTHLSWASPPPNMFLWHVKIFCLQCQILCDMVFPQKKYRIYEYANIVRVRCFTASRKMSHTLLETAFCVLEVLSFHTGLEMQWLINYLSTVTVYWLSLGCGLKRTFDYVFFSFEKLITLFWRFLDQTTNWLIEEIFNSEDNRSCSPVLDHNWLPD